MEENMEEIVEGVEQYPYWSIVSMVAFMAFSLGFVFLALTWNSKVVSGAAGMLFVSALFSLFHFTIFSEVGVEFTVVNTAVGMLAIWMLLLRSFFYWLYNRNNGGT
jgi:hypothetical membrane protein